MAFPIDRKVRSRAGCRGLGTLAVVGILMSLLQAIECEAGCEDSGCDDSTPCTVDSCNVSTGLCEYVPTPRGGCLAAGSSLLQSSSTYATSEKFKWRWQRGPAFECDDFGNLSSNANLELCVFDGSGAGEYRLAYYGDTASVGGWVQKSPCKWQLQYRVPGLLYTMSLRADDEGRSAINVRVSGAGVFPVSEQTFDLVPDVRVQLLSETGACWESGFSDADVLKNSREQFKAKTP